MAIVYQHIRKDTNEVFYVGIGKTEKRAHTKQGRNLDWYKIVNLYEYFVEIIYTELTWELASQMEKYLVKEYGRNDLDLGGLVNKTNGGDGTIGYKHTIETRKKLSIRAATISDETRKKMSEFAKNRKYSKETKLKMSVSHTGKIQSETCKEKLRKRIFSEETREKMSLWQKGKFKSEEAKKNMSIAQKGNVPWNKNKNLSEEHKQNLRKPKSEEHKQKLRKPKSIVKCPHCGLEGGSSNMKRYHFNNCKFIKK